MVNKKLVLIGLTIGLLLMVIGAGVVQATGAKLDELTCFISPYPMAGAYPSPSCSFFPLTARPLGNNVLIHETFTNGFNPAYGWQHTNAAWVVNNDLLHNDGVNNDASDRYVTWHSIGGLDVNAAGNLVISFQGRLKSAGNPQEGRGVVLGLGDGQGHTYEIRMENGYTNGGAVNPSISFILDDGHPLNQAIIAPSLPNRDTTYLVKAERKNGIWWLYINGVEAGSAPDTFASTHFTEVSLITVGSVMVDNVFISTK